MRAFILPLALVMTLAACQSTPPPSYEELTTALEAGEEVSVAELRRAFLAQEDFHEQVERLLELEEQVLTIVADEPLKLASFGSAILEQFYGSLTGHLAMARFYEHIGTADAAELHRGWLDKIGAEIDNADGSLDQPRKVMTRAEARAYMLTIEEEPVGGIYQSNEQTPFLLLMLGKPDDGKLIRHHFDIEPMYVAMRQRSATQSQPLETTPFTLIGLLARESDTAAQTAVGAFLASRQRTDDAIGWLRAASRAGNVLANTLLARIFYDKARDEEDEEQRAEFMSSALDNYVHAVALGSSDAMYSLAALYLSEQYGEENVPAGLPLLQRAVDLKHADATVYLAHLHAQGELVEASDSKAAALFVQASEQGNRRARTDYARFLTLKRDAVEADGRIVDWLKELAKNEDAEAMLLLGNLHARGVGASANNGTAVKWFKRAVSADPEDPNIVNEVAWTLTVSDVDGLARPEYAQKIMDAVMTTNEEARERPEYLDTWAAIYAANGNFERAVDLQEQALAKAQELNRDDVIETLEEHLAKFRAGEVIIEPAP